MGKKSIIRELKNAPQPFDFPEVEYKSLFVYKDGIPYLAKPPAKSDLTTQEKLLNFLEQCLELPYDGKDPSLQGMTQGQAMVINWTRQASHGDQDARQAIVDRLLGRPKQSVQSVQFTGDLTSFLQGVAKDMQLHTIEVPAEETINPHTSVEDL